MHWEKQSLYRQNWAYKALLEFKCLPGVLERLLYGQERIMVFSRNKSDSILLSYQLASLNSFPDSYMTVCVCKDSVGTVVPRCLV